jgi:peptidyl-dipeptidase Dcp
MSNPLVTPWPGPYGGVPPWDDAVPARFPEAFAVALAEQRAEIDRIAQGREAATFENTIDALERAGQTLDRVLRLFGVLRQNVSTPEIQALDREWQPKLAAAADEVVFTPGLFGRIEAVHRARGGSSLTMEQVRLTERVYDHFVRRGARLTAADQDHLSRLNQELAALFADFRAKVLADEDAWTVLDSRADLEGLPLAFVSAARAAAEERGIASGWIVLNTRSSVDPFLTFSTRRDLRERIWRRFKSRGDDGGVHDTNGIIRGIVKLRAERAQLLGFASHAHWRMTDTMARDPKAAQALMMQVWSAAVVQVAREVSAMQAIASAEGSAATIEPWDYLFYAEKVRKATYDLDQGELKPYFALDNMVGAALWSAEQRYDVRFTEITGTVPVFHADVRVFEVTDAPTGRHRGLFYLDNFARPGKRSGAWASSYRTQQRLTGATAIASNNNNFVKAAAGEPVLISLDDATTLFHEFGHALHSLLQDITYPGLSSTPRDFVEFPSQVNERWLLTRELLDRFARHVETGAPLPSALVERVAQSEQFNQGYATVEYLAAAILDMELHTRADGVFDPPAFERETLARIGMPREMALRHRLPHFDHLFGSDSYSAGYYSYLWSDVMAADAWQAFIEAGGPWDRTLAEKMRSTILAVGNTMDCAEAYRRFRGRDPEVKALLEKRGLPVER